MDAQHTIALLTGFVNCRIETWVAYLMRYGAALRAPSPPINAVSAILDVACFLRYRSDMLDVLSSDESFQMKENEPDSARDVRFQIVR